MNKQTSVIFNPLSFVLSVITGMIGYTINNNSLFWGIVDGLFWGFALVKWLIFKEINLSIIKETFSFFLY